jgi:hypothetical protein
MGGLAYIQPTALAGVTTQTTKALGSAVSLTTATPANITSVSLTAGTYLVWGIVDFALTGITATEFRVGVSVTSATLASQAGGSGLGPDPTSIFPITPAITTDTINDIAGPTILTIASTTTLYLVAEATFSAGTCAGYGTLNAIQINLP